MKIKKPLVLSLSTALCMVSSYAMSSPNNDVCTWSPANVICGNGTIPSLDAKGNAMLDHTTVQGITHIVGTLQTNGVSLNTLVVTGSSNLNETTVQGTSKIVGFMSASSSNFNGKITVTSDITHFDHTKTTDIEIIGNGHVEKICLNNNSIVNGSITFDEGNGLVISNTGSVISGKVNGGKIVKDTDC